jgi:NAD(P)-dependent dehydrogenase (short-subunit alcohol dehydrogenase family)
MSKTVLITGASSGIGAAAARLFQQKGWQVAATMRTPEKAADLAALSRVACLRLDVNDPATIAEALDAAIARFGRIDAVVNNAGYAVVGPFEASTPEQIQQQFDTNVFGVMRVTRAILPHFRAQGGGTLVNVTSMGGRITFPLYSLYHATKWAVEGFSESLQFELRPFDIKVKLVEPGPIKTDFYDRSMDVISTPGLEIYDDFVNRAMPTMQKAGADGAPPEAVAEVIYKAAKDDGWKLRYPVNAAAILSLRKVLPDAAFNGFVRKAVLG